MDPIVRKHLASYLSTASDGAGPIPLFVTRHCIPRSIEPHRHDFFEVELVLSGTGENRLGSQSRPIEPGAVFLGNQFEDHSIQSWSDITILSVKFSPELLPGAGLLLEPFVAPVPAFRCRLPDFNPAEQREFTAHAETLFEEYRRRGSWWQTAATAALTSILVALRRSYDRFVQQLPPSLGGVPHPLVIEILSFFDARFRGALSMADLEAHLGYSRAHLNRIFRSVAGQGLKEYLTAKRIRHACTLLQTTSLSITEVALSSGFQDISHFNRVFRARTAKAPGQVRLEVMSENDKS